MRKRTSGGIFPRDMLYDIGFVSGKVVGEEAEIASSMALVGGGVTSYHDKRCKVYIVNGRVSSLQW